MRKYITLFFSVFPFLIGCNGSSVPDGIIPPNQMTPLLTDVYLTDGRMSAYQQLPDTIYKYGTARYLAVFKKHGVDSAQFRKSYLYYTSQPQQMLDMNVKILAVLQTKTDSLKTVMDKQQRLHPKKAIPPAGAVSTLHPSGMGGGAYGAGMAPHGAAPGMSAGRPKGIPQGIMHRFRAKQDSLIRAKAHLK